MSSNLIKPTLTCKLCGKTFRNDYNLRTHLNRTHSTVRPYKCEYCGKDFKHATGYGGHLVVAHGIGSKNGMKKAAPNKHDKQHGNNSKSDKGQLDMPVPSENSKPDTATAGNIRRVYILEIDNLFPTKEATTSNDQQPSTKTSVPTTKINAQSNLSTIDRISSLPRSSQSHQPEINNNLDPHVASSISNSVLPSTLPTTSHNRHSVLNSRITTSKNSSSKSRSRHSSSSISSKNNNKHNEKTKISSARDKRKSTMSIASGGRQTKLLHPNKRRPSITCDICNEPFANLSTLENHMRTHGFPNEPENTGVTALDLTEDTTSHEKTVHALEIKAPAETVRHHDVPKANTTENNSTSKEEKLSNNIQVTRTNATPRIQPKSVRCPKCLKPFRTETTMKLHITLMHPTQTLKYTCPTCRVSFKTSDELKSHTCKQDKYVCDICKFKCDTSNTFITHRRTHEKGFLCRICNKCFDSKYELEQHSKQNHLQHRPYKCEYCDSRSSCLSNLLRHMKLLHNRIETLTEYRIKHKIARKRKSRAKKAASPVYTCVQCKFTFPTETLLRRHVIRVHWKEDDKKHKMKQRAEQRAKKKRNDGKRVVVNANINDKRYECETCGAVFIQQTKLRDHIRDKHLDDSEHAKYNEYDREDMHVNKKDTETHNITDEKALKSLSSSTKVRDESSVAEKERIELNKEVLKNYHIPDDLLKPKYFNNETCETLYICKICSTSFTARENFIRHIRERAADHGVYLMKTDNQGIQNKETDEVMAKVSDKTGIQLTPTLTPRIECDVCESVFVRKYNLLSHRQRHTSVEFKSSGAKENIYKSPDGKMIISGLHLYYKHVPSSVQEVSSSTNKGMIDAQSKETGDEEAMVYMDTAEENDFNLSDEEPLYTARRLSAENDIYQGLEQDENMSYQADYRQEYGDINNEREQSEEESDKRVDSYNVNNVQAIETIKSASKPVVEIVYLNKQNTEQILSTFGKDLTKQMETTNEINTHGLSNTVEIAQINTNNEIAKEGTAVNTNTPLSIHVQAHIKSNESKTISESCAGTSASVTYSVPSVSTIGDNNVCTTCKMTISGEIKSMRCKFCDQVFCVNCSGLPKHIYSVLFTDGNECPAGILWTCNICRHLVPKFTVLLQQLGDFEHIICNRLSDMEQRLSKIKTDGKP